MRKIQEMIAGKEELLAASVIKSYLSPILPAEFNEEERSLRLPFASLMPDSLNSSRDFSLSLPVFCIPMLKFSISR